MLYTMVFLTVPFMFAELAALGPDTCESRSTTKSGSERVAGICRVEIPQDFIGVLRLAFGSGPLLAGRYVSRLRAVQLRRRVCQLLVKYTQHFELLALSFPCKIVNVFLWIFLAFLENTEEMKRDGMEWD
jgi:hypothetical protein